MLTAGPARAAKLLLGPDGRLVEAQEFQVGLDLVALTGSVPNEWINQFRCYSADFGNLIIVCDC